MYKRIARLSTTSCGNTLTEESASTTRVKIQANGIDINVRDRGRGEPTLVLLHYWGGSSRTWAELIDQLVDQYRSIAIDHRGWGESDAPVQGYGLSDLADDAQSVISAM